MGKETKKEITSASIHEELRKSQKKIITVRVGDLFPINSSVKIKELQDLEKELYGPLIREYANSKDTEGLQNLVYIFQELGDLNKSIADNIVASDYKLLNGKLKYYTDSAIFYQYVLNITIVGDTGFTLEEPNILYGKLAEIRNAILLATTNNDIIAVSAQEEIKMLVDKMNTLKKDIESLRTYSKEEMQRLENIRLRVQNFRSNGSKEDEKSQSSLEQNYVIRSRDLFQHITTKMKCFLQTLFDSAQKEIGEPPCDYAIIGLGSIALQQITPYSDLKFAILTENENYKNSEDLKVKNYFKNLSHFVHFKIINIGETIIPASRYKDKNGVDLYLGHLVHQAVSFDLSGKTSLGRVDHNDKYYGTYNLVRKRSGKAD